MNVVATTSSALAAGLLRYELAGKRLTAAAAPSGATDAAATDDDASDGNALAVYDARGRVASKGSSEEMVAAVGDLLSARSDVQVDAAALKRVLDVQGSLLDVLA